MHPIRIFTILGLSAALSLFSACSTEPVEYKVISKQENSPACQLSANICVETRTFRKIDYEKDEMLLAYDSKKAGGGRLAETVLKKYKLREKRSDALNSIKTTMITAATNGQDPYDLTRAINSNEKGIEASTSNFYTSTLASAEAGDSYPLELTGVAAARNYTSGRGIVIGMVDTPVDINTSDSLHANIEVVPLVSFGDERNRLHGTEVAGVLVSRNPRIGIAPEANLYAISAFSTNPLNPGEHRSNSGLVARAIEYAIKRKVDILNLSFAGRPDPIVDKLVQAAVRQGIVVVAAAGNNGPYAKPAYPAALPGVIAVTAVDKKENLFGRANRGGYITLAAPGVDILTTAPRNSFTVSSGTSLATAHASGIIALLMSLDRRNFQPSLLYQTAIDLGRPGRDSDYGYGLINAQRALGSIESPLKRLTQINAKKLDL